MELKEAADATIRARLAQLKQLPRAELESLPASSSQKMTLAGHVVTITTYREQAEQGECRVVVQVSTPMRPFLKFFATNEDFAAGIAFNADGAIRDLQENELYDYT